jgi:hypothetical protein
MTENDGLRKEARERAEMKFSFYINIALYIIINGILIAIWYFNGMGFPWIIFPLIGWGIGVVAHYLTAFVYPGKKYLDGMAEKEYEKLSRG